MCEPWQERRWTFPDMYETASDGMIMFNKARVSETYLVDKIVPQMEASQFTPLVPASAGMTQQPSMVLDWHAPGAVR